MPPASPDTFKQLILSKHPDGIASDGRRYADIPALELTQKVVAKYPYGVTNDGRKYSSFLQISQPAQDTGTLTSPIKEGISGLVQTYKDLPGKLAEDVQAGATDIQKGGMGTVFGIPVPNVVKGIAKAGLRTAGDVAGAIFAPVGAAIGATGVGKVFEQVGEFSQQKGGIIDRITDIPAVQKFALEHPNAGEDFGRAMNLVLSRGGGKIEPTTAIPRTISQVKGLAPKVPSLTRPVEQLKAERVTEGYLEQNTRLKTAQKAFSDNTRTYTDPITKTKTTITPVDTLARYNIAPVVEKGTINMGDYKQGVGALGKIKESVSGLDDLIETHIANNGRPQAVDTFREQAIAKAKADPILKETGKVSGTVAKINAIFDDFKSSYGDALQTSEINSIRKTMNQDWSIDTHDTSRIIGDVGRDIVYKTTPDLQVKTLLRQQGELLAAKKYAERINGTKVVGGRLGNLTLRTIGSIMGVGIDKLPVLGPLIGMVGGEYVARGLQQLQFKSPVAEVRGLLQRSKSSEPTASANSTARSSVITPNTTTKTPTKQAPITPKVDVSTIDERLAPLADKNGMVTVYRAAPKFPTDTFAKDTHFATDPKNARYYAESHYAGEPSDITVRSVQVPASLLKRGGSADSWQLKESYPVPKKK